MTVYRVATIIQGRIEAVSGVKAAPVNPPNTLSGQWPFSVAFLIGGNIKGGGNAMIVDNYRIRAMIHYSNTNLAAAYYQINKYFETITGAILSSAILEDGEGVAGYITDPDGVDWDFGDSEWNGVPTLAFQIDIPIKQNRS
jgi:hypothetical protein